jgi:hypothetical protein
MDKVSVRFAPRAILPQIPMAEGPLHEVCPSSDADFGKEPNFIAESWILATKPLVLRNSLGDAMLALFVEHVDFRPRRRHEDLAVKGVAGNLFSGNAAPI